MNELSSHLNSSGEARMVDISEKAITVRVAKAECKVVVSTEVISLIKNDELPKGDALSVARIAGIQAAKKTPDLIDRKSTRLNSSHVSESRMPSSA